MLKVFQWKKMRGAGDLVAAVVKPIGYHPAGLPLKLPCYDDDGHLKPESGCGKRREKLNKTLPFKKNVGT
jgi:hypothetical protein